VTPAGDEHAWIVRADARDAIANEMAEARRRLARARAALGLAGGAGRRLLAKVASLVPGAGLVAAREAAAGLEAALRAIDRGAEWQQARATYADALLRGLMRAPAPRAWAGPAERPALLLGIGGGGTRVLGEAAARLGLHLGGLVNESFDSVEWAPLVYSLVEAAGDATEFAREREGVREVAGVPSAAGRRELPRGASAREAILAAARAHHGAWAERGGRWGVKLPEATLVLPQLLDALPGARVVLLARHPVASALRRDHVTTRADHPLGRRVLAAAYRAAGRDPARVASDPQHLRNALVWRHALGRAHRFIAAEVAPDRALRLRFEDFALRPRATAERLARFLELEPPREQDLAAVDVERAARATDARAEADVREVAGPLAAELGYGPGWRDEPCERPERRGLFPA
jgi:hypothetical protein